MVPLVSTLSRETMYIKNTRWGKSRFTVISETEFILLLFINYCIVFYMNSCKPIFATPCIALKEL